MESWMVNVLTKGRGKDFSEIKEYGDCAYKMREYILLFRDLVFKNINVIFNAWEMQLDVTNVEGMIVTKTYPKLFKKLASEACGLVDMVGRLEMYPKTGDRYIRFEPTRDIMAKSGLKGVEKFEVASFPDIFAKLWAYNYQKEK
jgi:phage nucleotide-binding protein